MNNKAQLPDSETIQRTVNNWREVCRNLDNLNLLLDEALASAEADIRHSPLTTYRLGRLKSPKSESVQEA